jgi:hypothetical protein
LQMSETRILIRLLWIYFPRISEFGSASDNNATKAKLKYDLC